MSSMKKVQRSRKNTKKSSKIEEIMIPDLAEITVHSSPAFY